MITENLTDGSVIKLLKIIAKYDVFHGWDNIFWTKDMEFRVLCNDIFWWGTGDAEEITEDDLTLFEESLKDGGWEVGYILYCARRRKMRPQGAAYSIIPEKYWPMFDACGPERKTDFGNPYRKGEYERKTNRKDV